MKLATYLTYTHASLWGCTFKEALITLISLQAVSALISLITKFVIGTAVYTLLPGFFIALVSTGAVLKIIGEFKKGKQEGYLSLKTRLILNHYFNKSVPYVTRDGCWSTRRTKRG